MKKLLSKILKLFFIISCQRYSELSSHQLDRKLSWKEKVAFRIHNLHCAFCRRFYKQIKALDAVARSANFKERLPDQKMPDSCRQKIAESLDRETADRS